jgi:hypothetical protein
MPKGIKSWGYDKKKVAFVKKIMRKLNLSNLITKLNKYPRFYGVLTEQNHRIELGQGHRDIPPHLMKEVEEKYRYYTHKPLLNHGLTSQPISVAEFFYIYMGFGGAVTHISKGSKIYPLMSKMEKVVQILLAHAMVSAHAAMVRATQPHSNLAGIGLITVEGEKAKTVNGEFSRFRHMISIEKPTIKNAVVKGAKRKGFEVLFWPKGDGSCLRMSAEIDGEQLPCYITTHTLKRIEERYDICEPWIARESVFNAANETECLSYDGNLLLPVNVNDKAIGYLVCEKQESFILFTTFLLVTHNGTPQGDALSQEVNLQHGDISKLNLDRLSSFKSNLIEDDRLLHSVLEMSSLAYLLSLDPKEYRIPPYVDWQTTNHHGEKLHLLNGVTD